MTKIINSVKSKQRENTRQLILNLKKKHTIFNNRFQ